MRLLQSEAIGDHPLVGLIGRIVLTAMFWTSALEKITNFPGTVAQVERYGLHPAPMIAGLTILVQSVGSALVIWNGRFTCLGAGALAVFTLATIPVAHAYWTLQGPARAADMHLVMEHVAVVGALLILVANVPRRPVLTPPLAGKTALRPGGMA